jgi:lipid-A-disaccharide synthase
VTTVLVSAGDASGDAYAADLVRALRARQPGTRFLGLGGPELARAGVELAVDQRELAAGGFLELLPDLPRIARAWRRLTTALDAARPDLAVLVDSAGFNLPLARRARRAGAATLYYICPQVWAWRRGRLRKLARRIDRLAVILPFEREFYAAAGIPVDFVGHPLIDRLAARGAPLGREAARAALGLEAGGRLVALLPGSRRGELRHGLPLYLASARALHASDPSVAFVLPLASSIEPEFVRERLRAAALPTGLRLSLAPGRSLEALAACDVALAKPGTATLEAALLGRPLVVAARVSALSAALVRRLVTVDWLALPNLLAGREVVPELLQQEARPERIARALAERFEGPLREEQLAAFAELRTRLGGAGAARRAAEIAEEMLLARRAA